jgi:N-glycosylase/DNA lyase
MLFGMSDLFELYTAIQREIDTRLDEFRSIWARGIDHELFRELAFCACTPQTNAQHAWRAVCRLNTTLEQGSHDEIAAGLRENGVRFHNNKAAYIVANRARFFPNTKAQVSSILQSGSIVAARETLVRHVAGWGLKEASHFLRNTGHGSAICILDRHILRQLASYGVIPALPTSLSGKTYRAIETAMMEFARNEAIPVDALDLVFWFKAKSEVFK